MEIKKLVIDRAKWGRQYLLTPYTDGKMCCLGHLGRACGVSAKVLRGRGMPKGLKKTALAKYPKSVKSPVAYDAYDATYKAFDGADNFPSEAAYINDSSLKGYQKERKLISLFKRNGITLGFTGRTTKDKVDSE